MWEYCLAIILIIRYELTEGLTKIYANVCLRTVSLVESNLIFLLP